jgi:hypothetical protein
MRAAARRARGLRRSARDAESHAELLEEGERQDRKYAKTAIMTTAALVTTLAVVFIPCKTASSVGIPS